MCENPLTLPASTVSVKSLCSGRYRMQVRQPMTALSTIDRDSAGRTRSMESLLYPVVEAAERYAFVNRCFEASYRIVATDVVGTDARELPAHCAELFELRGSATVVPSAFASTPGDRFSQTGGPGTRS